MRSNHAGHRMWAAVAAIALITPSAWAQVRANQDGRAADANTRVGSGGINSPGVSSQGTVTANDIVYGNVTGGKEFRGPRLERDPRAFTGPMPGTFSDQFVKGSTAPPEPYQPSIGQITPEPYFGFTRGVGPPLGSVREGYTGSYVGTDLVPNTPLSLASQYNSGDLAVLTQRTGTSRVLGTGSALFGNESEMFMEGPLRSQSDIPLFAASPLYGVRALQPGETPTDTDVLAETGPSAIYPWGSGRYRVENPEVRRLRAELRALSQPYQGAPDNRQQQGGEEQQPGNQQNNNQRQPGRLQGYETPENPRIQNRTSNAITSPNLAAPMGAQQQPTPRQALAMLTPQQQSTQYNELTRRLRQYEGTQAAIIEQERQQRQQILQSQQGTGVARTAPRIGQMREFKITSLATGIRPKSLHDLLESAEKLMRDGQFQKAIDQYNTAEQAVPNQPLIPLGRANAELGAGFYRLASSSLHRVFLGDPALLTAQYDLNAWMPPKRLQAIIQELRELSDSEKRSEMAPFLLAYIYYNTGQRSQAAEELAEAERRAGNADPILKLLRRYWNLSSATTKPSAPAELNK